MKAKCMVIICLLCVFLMGCGGSEYYQDTSLENFRTFTSVTGIESTSSEVEGNDTYYYYNVTLDDEMFTKIAEWEAYLLEYGFSYVTSEDGVALYVKDGYYLSTFINGATTESVQYVVGVPKENSNSLDNSYGNSSNQKRCLYEYSDGSVCWAPVTSHEILCDKHYDELSSSYSSFDN